MQFAHLRLCCRRCQFTLVLLVTDGILRQRQLHAHVRACLSACRRSCQCQKATLRFLATGLHTILAAKGLYTIHQATRSASPFSIGSEAQGPCVLVMDHSYCQCAAGSEAHRHRGHFSVDIITGVLLAYAVDTSLEPVLASSKTRLFTRPSSAEGRHGSDLILTTVQLLPQPSYSGKRHQRHARQSATLSQSYLIAFMAETAVQRHCW